MSKINLACVITTHSRVEDAKGQMDLIRDKWTPYFTSIDIYHEFNGEKKWYPKKYREDFLFRHPKMPHLKGAIYLIEQGIKDVLESKKEYDFIIVASSDAWVYDPKKIYELIQECQDKGYELATSIWFGTGLATEFFIITPSLAKKVFPLNYEKYLEHHKIAKVLDSYSHTKLVEKYIPWSKMGTVEFYFTKKALGILKNPKEIYLIPGRKFVFHHNRFHSKGFYSSHHDREKKLKAIQSTLLEPISKPPNILVI